MISSSEAPPPSILYRWVEYELMDQSFGRSRKADEFHVDGMMQGVVLAVGDPPKTHRDLDDVPEHLHIHWKFRYASIEQP